jgi:hypothetical protein
MGGRRRSVKKVIEYLETALKKLGYVAAGIVYTACKKPYSDACDFLRVAITELKNRPRWETPEQYEKRTGEKWPDEAPVWERYVSPNSKGLWELEIYNEAKDTVEERREHGYTWTEIVLATKAGIPPDDWKPEEVK